MVRSLVLLLDLLTDYQDVEAIARNVFTFGLANTAMVCLICGFEIVRRMKAHETAASPPRI